MPFNMQKDWCNEMVRLMTIEDYEEVHALWMKIKGFAIRSIDDSREGVERFLRRNPTTSVVAVEDGRIVGAILCGHDGRQGCLYHVCVDPAYRRRGIGKTMVVFCMEALRKEQINKVYLIAILHRMMKATPSGIMWDGQNVKTEIIMILY